MFGDLNPRHPAFPASNIGWQVLTRWSFSQHGAVASTGLPAVVVAGLSEVMFVYDRVTASASCIRAVVWSTNGGASWPSASGNVQLVNSDGSTTSEWFVPAHSGGTTTIARSGFVRVNTAPISSSAGTYFCETARGPALINGFNGITHLRTAALGSNANWTGGSIMILAR